MPRANRASAGPAPIIGGIALGLLAMLAARQTASSAPFGVPIPRPQAVYDSNVAVKDTDVLARRIPPPFLEFLASAPDGTIPLRYGYSSDRGAFSMSFPTGAETVSVMPADFVRTGVDAVTEFKFNQAIKRIVFRYPLRQPGEKVTDFVARLRYELGQNGLKVAGDAMEPVLLKEYRFERVEYSGHAALGKGTSPAAEGGLAEPTDAYHVLLIGPMGPRVLIVDFLTTVPLIKSARPEIDKIIQSFSPHYELAKVMLQEDPTYGELARPARKKQDAAAASSGGFDEK